MKNTKKIALKAAFDNVDETVYNKTVQWWADDVMNTFGEHLMSLYSEGATQPSREFYGKSKITAEIKDWLQGGSAAYCMCCLDLLESESDWDVDDANEAELSEYIISGIASDVATEVMRRLEEQLLSEGESNPTNFSTRQYFLDAEQSRALYKKHKSKVKIKQAYHNIANMLQLYPDKFHSGEWKIAYGFASFTNNLYLRHCFILAGEKVIDPTLFAADYNCTERAFFITKVFGSTMEYLNAVVAEGNYPDLMKQLRKEDLAAFRWGRENGYDFAGLEMLTAKEADFVFAGINKGSVLA